VSDALANRFGALHGGMTAAMMDDVISLAAGLSVEWGQITPTLEMKVSYIRQGKLGAGSWLSQGQFVEAARLPLSKRNFRTKLER
jgi:uncharacterized protein (TIGR00369 family)